MPGKKPRPIYLQYKCKDGSRTVAATAAIGLSHWYGRTIPTKPIEDPKPFGIYVVGAPLAGPYDPLFLPLVVAALERGFGKAPPVASHLLDPKHGETLKSRGDFRAVARDLRQGVAEVVEYEETCLQILRWLQEQGEITEMIFDQAIQPLDW
jgi:hypothetical protein